MVPCDGLYRSSGHPISGLWGPPQAGLTNFTFVSDQQESVRSPPPVEEAARSYCQGGDCHRWTKFLHFSQDRMGVLVTAGPVEWSSVCRQPALKARGLRPLKTGSRAAALSSARTGGPEQFSGRASGSSGSPGRRFQKQVSPVITNTLFRVPSLPQSWRRRRGLQGHWK